MEVEGQPVSTKDVRFALRIPAKMHSEVKALAETEFRSVNAQIISLIQEALLNRKARESQANTDTKSGSKDSNQKPQQANMLQQLHIDDIAGLYPEVALTPKQEELLNLLVKEDLSYRELSRILGINASSVRDRTSTILRKLGVESRSELLDKVKERTKSQNGELPTENQ